MSTIKLDSEKANRIIAQVLRDDAKMLPEVANSIAGTICRRLITSMPLPTNPGLHAGKIIWRTPPSDSGFTEAISEKIADVDDRVAWALWEMVYARGVDLAPDVADAARF